jgi:hypothetical protein
MTIEIPSDPKRLKGLIDRRHPEYADKLEHWDFMHETYLGPREWFKKNLFQFNREGAETFKGRLERAYRFNHTREVVDLVNKYLFKSPPQRSPNPSDAVARFRERATLSGLDIHEFERQAGRAASIFGRAYVVVDNNYSAEAPTTLAEEKALDAQLYAYIVYPIDFLDCGYDEQGQYSWVLLREKTRLDDDPFNEDSGVFDRYRLWTKDYWALFGTNKRGKVELLEFREHDLNVVPVLKVDHVESDAKYVVPALIEDIAYLDRAGANYLSNLDQIINDQTFSQLIMPAQGVLNGAPAANSRDPDDPDHEAQRRHVAKLGTAQILLYDGEHGGEPKYINPDPRQAGIIMQQVEKIISEIYHTVGLAGERTKADNSMGIDNSSGVAKAFDFERVSALLSAKANAMQSLSNRMEILVRIYAGEGISFSDRSEPSVIYPTNFDVRNLAEELSIAQELGLLSAPMEIRKRQMTEVINKLWPIMSSEDKKKMEKSLDEWEDGITMLASANYNDSSVNDGKPGQGAVGGKKAVGKVSK